MTEQRLKSIPVLILYPHRRCNCRCLMCDIWKESEHQQMSPAALDSYLEEIANLGVQWLVLSGGEPLMHSDLFRFCDRARELGIRITILSSGLLLERHAERIAHSVDDLIVSLDGPQEVHDRIRRVHRAYERLAAGVAAIHKVSSGFAISARSTVQKANHHLICETAEAAQALGMQSISYLAVDTTSTAFNHAETEGLQLASVVGLNGDEIRMLEGQAAQLLKRWNGSGFVRENEEKWRAIIRHFQAQLGMCQPVAPRCNAPWFSAVLETDGTLRPCFFQPPYGQLGSGSIDSVLNGFEAQRFRSDLNVETNAICRRCVCSLRWQPDASVPISPPMFTKFSHLQNKASESTPLSSFQITVL